MWMSRDEEGAFYESFAFFPLMLRDIINGLNGIFGSSKDEK